MANIAELVGLLGKGKGAKFGDITYRTVKTGELSRYNIILGASTQVLYKKDIEILQVALTEGILDGLVLSGLYLEAAKKVLASRLKSLEVGIGNNPNYVHAPQNADTYVTVDGVPGMKIHKETGELHIVGLLNRKEVIEEGEYKEVKSRPETLAKKEIEKRLPSIRFRQFKLKGVKRCAANGEVLEIEAE